jgi:hypothetical protein
MRLIRNPCVLAKTGVISKANFRHFSGVDRNRPP